jgi:hypothetical protein
VFAGSADLQQQVQQAVRQEVQPLLHQINIARRSTRSATDVGKDLMNSPSWQQGHSTNQIIQMLADCVADPQNIVQQLLQVIPHDWLQLSAAEKELRSRESRKRKQGAKPITEQTTQPGPAQGGQVAGGEATIQLGMMYILRKVRDLVPGVCWHLHDTSASGLAGRQGAIDISFTATALKVWAQLLFYSELKPRLQPLSAQHEVVGQLSDRSVDAFEQQPSQRSHIFGFAAGADAVQIVCMRKHDSPLHTGLQSLSFEPNSPGLLLMLRLVLAKRHSHGFVEVYPPPISIPGSTLSHFDLVDWQMADEVHSGSHLAQVAAITSSTVCNSQVWRACWHDGQQPPQEVAVKTGPFLHIKSEVCSFLLVGYASALRTQAAVVIS